MEQSKRISVEKGILAIITVFSGIMLIAFCAFVGVVSPTKMGYVNPKIILTIN
jgi:hypothetical protein